MKPAAYTGLGLAVVSAGVGIFFHAKSYATASNLNRKEGSNGLSASDLPDYGAIDRDVHIARGFYVAAAVLGLAGGGLLFWDSNAFGIQGRF